MLVSAACIDEETTTIAPYLGPCTGVANFACLQKIGADGKTTNFFGPIEGFTFVWGETRRVTYSTEEISNPPQDGGSLRFELVDSEVVDVADPADEFTMFFYDRGDLWFDASQVPGRVEFFRYEIACDAALCEELVDHVGTFQLRLQFGAPAGAVATALAIE
ncbi:MAG: DUF4377 domain-containing protein [Kofleriaceae bacterium]|nr:DUF4377 domain-containing protein [Kofleriaceae bacterium]